MTAAQQSSAARMIAAKGQTVTYRAAGSVTYDPTTARGDGYVTPQTVKAVLLPLGGARHVFGENIALGNVQCLMAAVDTAGAAVAPAVDGIVTDAGGTGYVITAVATLNPAGVAIMHDLVLRGAA